MANTKGLTKQYQQLSEKERAQLMINADINEDEQEFQRLMESAPVKRFRIRGDREHETFNAWHWTHKDYLLCKNFLSRKLLMAGNLLDEEDYKPSAHSLLQEMTALDLAFVDVLETHGLPINEYFLKAFGCEPDFIDKKLDEVDKIKEGVIYQGYLDLFESTCTKALRP